MRDAVDQRRGAGRTAAARRQHGCVRQPLLRGISLEQHSGSDQRSGRRAGLPLHRAGADPRYFCRRQLRRAHTQHHRRPVVDRSRRAQPRRVTERWHDGLAPGRVRRRRRRRPARARGHSPGCRCRTAAGRGRGASLWRAGDRPRHARAMARRGRAPHPLRPRCPRPGRISHRPSAGSLMAPGGQLVQETDSWLGVWGARVVLVDDTGVRARMTASWLRRMGWDAAVLDNAFAGVVLETGEPAPDTGGFALAGPEPAMISAAELRANARAVIVDLAQSRRYRQGHLPGAWFAVRARLPQALDRLPAGELVLTSEDGVIARFAAAEIGARRPARVLDGGTAAWQKAGLPLEAGMSRVADEPDDVALSARERPADRERYMREYLAWEVDLVNQVARDSDCRFRLAPVNG